MKTRRGKKIRARYGLTKLTDGEFGHLLAGSLNGLTANADIYSKPPVSPEVYRAGIDAYQATIPAALDGSKTAKAERDKLRDAVARMYVQLAHYAEANCNEDPATFLLSGFQLATTTKTAAQHVERPSIESLVQGPGGGQMKLRITNRRGARSYDYRYAPVPDGGGPPASWTEDSITSARSTIITGLTPGTRYVFQVRALGSLGRTDWSDPVNRIAT